MEPLGRVIYSKRYPYEDIGDLKMNADTVGAGTRKRPDPSEEEFLQHLLDDSIFVYNAERQSGARDFIHLAEELSRDYEIGADIIAYPYYVSVTLYLYCSTYMNELKEMLVDLLMIGDDITFANSKTQAEECIIIIDYMTHDCYFEGRKVN